MLTLKGERKSEAPKGYAAHRRERAPVQFSRSFALPCKVDLEKTTALIKDGVLTVTMAKGARGAASANPGSGQVSLGSFGKERTMKSENSMQTRASDAPEKIEQRPTTAPLVDIYENADELLVVADMPGVANDKVTINFDKGQLTIEGRRGETTGSGLIAAEYRPLDFSRTFLVPQGIDTDKIEAELQHGVLRVHLPKSAALKPRQIQVKAG